MRFGCPECFQKFFLQKIFSFITFGHWVGVFLISGLVLFGAITKSAFYGYGGNILWIFEEVFSFFKVLRHWAENFSFWQNLVAGLSKLLFHVYRRALWRQTFLEGVLIFHPSRILINFSLLLQKRLWARLSTLQPSLIVKHSEKLLFSWKNMILLWFSALGKKLPFVWQIGSQNCLLGVRMNVSRKCKSSECFQNFYQFRTSSENFSGFWQKFSAELSNSLLLVQSELLRRTIWRLFQFCIICGHWAFFVVFGHRLSAFVKNAVWVSRRMFPKTFVCRKFFLLSLSGIE